MEDWNRKSIDEFATPLNADESGIVHTAQEFFDWYKNCREVVKKDIVAEVALDVIRGHEFRIMEMLKYVPKKILQEYLKEKE